jgi:hypothetical protein
VYRWQCGRPWPDVGSESEWRGGGTVIFVFISRALHGKRFKLYICFEVASVHKMFFN